MFGLSVTELIIVLLIVLLIFGPRRLKNIGSDLGNAIRGFRKAVTEDESKAAEKEDPSVIEGEVAGQKAGQKKEAKQETRV